MTILKSRSLTFLLLIVLLFAADQFSKGYLLHHFQPFTPVTALPVTSAPVTAQTAEKPSLQPEQSWPFREVKVLPFFSVVSVWNYGVSFGLGNDDTASGRTFQRLGLISLSLVVGVALTVWLLRTKSVLIGTGAAMVSSGAFGNMVDRIRYGAVFDFLDFHAFGYHWPAFNIADAAIVLGSLVLAIGFYLTPEE